MNKWGILQWIATHEREKERKKPITLCNQPNLKPNFRIPGIPTINFQQKLYSQNKTTNTQSKNKINKTKMILVKHKWIIWYSPNNAHNVNKIIKILLYQINNEICKETIQQKSLDTKLIAIRARVCDVHLCSVFMDMCHGFVLFLFCLSMCVRMPLSSRSIADLASSRALPYYCTPPVCVLM